MSSEPKVAVDKVGQVAVPGAWRQVLIDIVDAIRTGQDLTVLGVPQVRAISREDADRIRRNISSYGCQLVALPDAAWDTSVSQWMRGHWEVLVDLYTLEEGASDLVLSARVFETEGGYEFEVQSVHVP